RAAPEDGVVLVLALRGVALAAALLDALDPLVPVVPAARPLTEVAADRAHIPDLGRGDRVRGLSQRGVGAPDDGMLLDLDQRDERPQAQAFGAGLQMVQTGHTLQV